MRFVKSHGGREKYFEKLNVGDCVTRAICNATGKDYMEVYKALAALSKSSPRNGVYKSAYRKYLASLGYSFTPLMGIGTGCRTHLCEEELPTKGTYILKVSKHLTCIKDGVLYDSYDCSRGGTRCVYGYWKIK